MMDADAATSAAGASARPAAAGTRAAAGPAVEFQDVGKRYGSVAAVDGISFAIARGTLVTLLGPSGCGKTTTLRLIAGLEAPSSGRILIGGRDVTLLSAAERDVSMVFQSYALFPHMTVLENACYGLRASGLRRARAEEMARAKLALVGLEGFEARLPSELSGGQQQRVAVARAIVLEPQVLLFDEPLSNLDAKLRRRVREEIRGLQQSLGLTVAYVTHDQEEALAVSDRIIVMNGGRIAQDGPPRALYERPASRFVADFIGDANILPAVVDSVADGRAQVRLGPALLSLPDAGVPPGPALLAARPEAVALSRLPAHDAASGLAGVVRKTAYVGSHMEYEIAVEAPACALFATDRDMAAPLTPGDAVQIVLAATGVTLVPGD